MQEQNQPAPYTQEMIDCLSEAKFDLGKVHQLWYEKVIPVELIPEKYRQKSVTPSGIQILDSRVPGYTFYPDEGEHGAYKVCPDVWLDDIDP